ncbi:Ankyrin repeat domain-containing protein 2B [Chionoecetes opilio]|uniref:Ankyrin repeat domain-containing protein 2B n=1 Tax=Chionoecetes opilio TaxID=41210 RepID=A0A8J4YI90_CHIOP|nr:Ankyrin repeat domain-containing protein 2B [Chionoecetes opilio]
MSDDMRTVVSCIPGHIEVGRVYDVVLNGSQGSSKRPRYVQAPCCTLLSTIKPTTAPNCFLHLGAPWKRGLSGRQKVAGHRSPDETHTHTGRLYPRPFSSAGQAARRSCESELGDTALHIAARVCGHTFVALLLEYGASATSLNAAQDTPLHLAAERGRVHTVSALLENGAATSAKNSHKPHPHAIRPTTRHPGASMDRQHHH